MYGHTESLLGFAAQTVCTLRVTVALSTSTVLTATAGITPTAPPPVVDVQAPGQAQPYAGTGHHRRGQPRWPPRSGCVAGRRPAGSGARRCGPCGPHGST